MGTSKNNSFNHTTINNNIIIIFNNNNSKTLIALPRNPCQVKTISSRSKWDDQVTRYPGDSLYMYMSFSWPSGQWPGRLYYTVDIWPAAIYSKLETDESLSGSKQYHNTVFVQLHCTPKRMPTRKPAKFRTINTGAVPNSAWCSTTTCLPNLQTSSIKVGT